VVLAAIRAAHGNARPASLTGLRILVRSAHSTNMLRPYVSVKVRVAISLMSAPAAKARSLPVSTMAPTLSSSSNALAAAACGGR
jgi:hypothetical protein